ncbi:MAG: HAD family hydrolase [Candidatus Hodarchaeales archaeon]|jgi:HAD superfamily hydrolase (TIGR01549 family)
MKPKALLFDLDGTLVNTLRVFPQFIAQEFISNPNSKIIRYYLHRLGVIYNSGKKHSWFKPELFLTLKADFNLSWLRLGNGLLRVYWKFLKWDTSLHIFPEVIETLIQLKLQGYLLGIVSNGSPRLLNKRFGSHLDIFDVLIESKSIGFSKPSPIPLYYACSLLNINKADAVFIGDTLVDLLAARNAKMRVILVRTGVFGDNFPIADVGYEPISIIPAVGKDLIKVLSKM